MNLEPTGSEGTPLEGIAFRVYQMEVEARIKSNWQYPVALISPAKRKDTLRQRWVIKVSQDGTILKSWFSGYGQAMLVFDGSVHEGRGTIKSASSLSLKGYNEKYIEIVLRFNLATWNQIHALATSSRKTFYEKFYVILIDGGGYEMRRGHCPFWLAVCVYTASLLLFRGHHLRSYLYRR